MRKWGILPLLASRQGVEVDRLLLLVHVVLAIIFIGWLIYGVYVLTRFRKGRNPKANADGPKTRMPFVLEIVIVVVELTLLFGFSIPFWSQRVAAVADPGPDAVQIRLVAQQFVWNFHYPGADGKFGRTAPEFVEQTANPVGLDPSDPAAKDDIVTLNNLFVPVNKTVVLTMSSKDVVHSFSLPELRVKQDVIPGMATKVAFTPTMTTRTLQEIKGDPKRTFEVVCAQLCGLEHATMRGYLHVLEAPEFEKWLKDNKPSADALAPDPFAQ